jgi:hypothetical protein
MKTGVARRQIDLNEYRARLEMRQTRLMRLLEAAGSLA